MSDEVEVTEASSAPPIKRRGGRRGGRPKAVSKPQPLEEFPGLTVWNCCDTCGPRCVITAAGTGLCAHPAKSALQSPDANKPAVLAKYNRAKANLAAQQMEKRLGVSHAVER